MKDWGFQTFVAVLSNIYGLLNINQVNIWKLDSSKQWPYLCVCSLPLSLSSERASSILRERRILIKHLEYYNHNYIVNCNKCMSWKNMRTRRKYPIIQSLWLINFRRTNWKLDSEQIGVAGITIIRPQ